MKYFLPVVCSVLLIGCGDSAQNETPAAPQTQMQAAAPAETPAPVAAEETPAPDAQNAPVVAALATGSAPSVDSATMFAQKCASCHGMKAEKAALGKSQVIAGWNEQKIKDALKGYQAGTYGKEMKALMQGQAKGLSDAQIDALAKHISGL